MFLDWLNILTLMIYVDQGLESLRYLGKILGANYGIQVLLHSELKLPKKVRFIKTCSWFGRQLTFCYLFPMTSSDAKEIKTYHYIFENSHEITWEPKDIISLLPAWLWTQTFVVC